MPTSIELRQQRAKIVESMRAIVACAESNSRGLNEREQRHYDSFDAQFRAMGQEIERQERQEVREAELAEPIGDSDGIFRSGNSAPDRRAVRGKPGERITRAGSVVQWVRAAGRTADPDPASFGAYVKRALLEGGSAGVLVPEELSASVIDLARNASQVTAAGASVVPMASAKQVAPRVTQDPEVAWHAEGAAISESGIEFDSVTLTARTLPCLVRLSLELAEDAPGVETLISQTVGKVLAGELDKAAVIGSGVDPEPKGVINQTGVTKIAATGSATWDLLLDAQAAIESTNHEVTAFLLGSRDKNSLARQRATANGQYLAPPEAIANVKRLVTNKLAPVAGKSQIFAGQWDQMIIGSRTSMHVQPLNERFADTGEVGMLIHLRADVQLARPSAFAVITDVTAPA